MGPLVPDLISENLNYILALFIGIAFGAILEQAGFSSSRRLVGLFYGYDFTVLRVFFTAGIVGMIGVMALDHFRLLDMNQIYINPTYIWSAIVGGLLMGLGFVVGGYCPGTSFCAAAIGKLDALALIGGALVGVLLFGEAYPLLEGFHKAGYLGSPRISETLGISPSLFAAVIILIAAAAFGVVSVIEKRVNGRWTGWQWTRGRIAVAGVAIVLALSAFTFSEPKSALLREAEDIERVQQQPVRLMDVDEFAFRLMDPEDNRIQVIDFRTAEQREKEPLPKSYIFTVDSLFEQEPSRLLRTRGKVNVFVAEDELTERKMAYIAQRLGFQRVYILQGGMQAFREQILEYEPPATPPQNIYEQFTQRFRLRAKEVLPDLMQQSRQEEAPPAKEEKKRRAGGC